ncbi:7893_t:CDS:10 [Ambispora leptoticha]|uniref:DNA damage-inducible protein 1 n=1 Tax=Ambispora leptoticha TaxID=144679 RepID=A0A9N9AS16_9GLOM|nr:7893_t:CDS:10 [Ambispora leptoticha]
MRIAITTETGELHNVEVDSQIELENVKALIEAETGISTSDQILLYNGKELPDQKKTLEQYGVIQDSVLLLKRKFPANSTSDGGGVHGAPDVEQMRRLILERPDLWRQLSQAQPDLANAALNDPDRFAVLIRQMEQRRKEAEQLMNLQNADPFDIEAQRRIEEEIRRANVMANLQTALEYTPEAFGRVTMLYINVEVNGRPVKAFVDSGAQATISMIMRLVDTQFAGVAKGVGTAKIIGRVHSAQIRVGTDLFLACSFTIMEGRGVELLFGLDMLKRHQACIDLKRNVLIINEKEVPFLPEHELPESARMDEIADETIPLIEASTSTSTATSTTTTASTSNGVNTSNTQTNSNTTVTSSSTSIPISGSSVPLSSATAGTTQSKYPETDILKLVSLGIPREQAIQLLDLAGGNPDLAASFLFNE